MFALYVWLFIAQNNSKLYILQYELGKRKKKKNIFLFIVEQKNVVEHFLSV